MERQAADPAMSRCRCHCLCSPRCCCCLLVQMKDVGPGLLDTYAKLMEEKAQLQQEIERRVQEEAVPTFKGGCPAPCPASRKPPHHREHLD